MSVTEGTFDPGAGEAGAGNWAGEGWGGLGRPGLWDAVVRGGFWNNMDHLLTASLESSRLRAVLYL